MNRTPRNEPKGKAVMNIHSRTRLTRGFAALARYATAAAAIAVGPAFEPTASAQCLILAESRFEIAAQGGDGWRGINNDGGRETLVWVGDSAGGGFISLRENQGDSATMFFAAPLKFLGDQLAALGGSLQFRIKQYPIDQPYGGPTVVLVSAGTRLAYRDDLFPPKTYWHNHEVRLDARYPWYHQGTEIRATEQDLTRVLSSLDDLQIRGEFSNRQREETDLDDVILAAPEPTKPPDLSVTRLPDGRVEINWPGVYGCYRLEFTSAALGGYWQTVPPAWITYDEDGRWHARLHPDGEAAFFRLRRE